MHLAEIGTPSYRDTLYYKGYQLYAAALGYLWNNWFEEAFEAEQHFIKQELWDDFEIGIHAYLSVLIIKKQTAHLDELFKDDAFKEKFIAHYEVFISLLVNPDYRVTQSWMILTPIINKIRETESQHGLQKIL